MIRQKITNFVLKYSAASTLIVWANACSIDNSGNNNPSAVIGLISIDSVYNYVYDAIYCTALIIFTFFIISIILLSSRAMLTIIKISFRGRQWAKENEWDAVKSHIEERYNKFKDRKASEIKYLFNNNGKSDPNDFAIMADIVVEKAQIKLERKGRRAIGYGVLFAVFATLMLLITAYELFKTSVPEDIKEYPFYMMVFKNTAFATFIGGAAYIFFSISRAFIHEGIGYYNKRHALRLGIIYIFQKSGNFNFKEFEGITKWNELEPNSFKDISPEVVTRTIPQKLLSLPSDIVKATSDRINKGKTARRTQDG